MGRKAIGWIAALAILAALAGGAAVWLTGAEPAGEREMMSADGRAETPVAPAAAADAGGSVAVTPEATPATVGAASEATATPATATSEATPEATPEPTPEPTPEATPEPAPEATPEATPGDNAAAIAAMRETVRGLRPPAYRATAADMRDLVYLYGGHVLPRQGGWRVCINPLYGGKISVPGWLTLDEFFAITEIAVATWNALLEPDPFRASVTECPPDMWGNAGRPKGGLIIVGFDDDDRANGGWGRRHVEVGRGQTVGCAPSRGLAAIIVHELGHGLGLGHAEHGVMHAFVTCNPTPTAREAAVAQRFFHGAPARLDHYRAEQRRLIAAEAAAPAGPAFVPPLRDGESGQLTIWRGRGETDEAAIRAALDRDACSRVTRVVGGFGDILERLERDHWPSVMILAEHHAREDEGWTRNGRFATVSETPAGTPSWLVEGMWAGDALLLVDCG